LRRFETELRFNLERLLGRPLPTRAGPDGHRGEVQNGTMGAELRLTRRAKEVAELVALGLTNREIAGRLFLSERTVEWHVEQVFNKLGFSSRSQIAAWVVHSQFTVAVPGSRQRGNLPAQFTSFVGRDRELRALLDMVTANRLVTVTGSGGTGKTRLALRLAEEVQPDFKHGVWLCDLAPLAVPDLVADALAQALDVKQPASNRLDAVRERLRDRSALLVLDNCEHVLTSAAEMVRDLLAACHGVRILATSRSPLGVIGEAICRLDPMPKEDAMQLFNDRATAAVPNFRIDGPNADRIAAICDRLDGVPLAIELVVPRLRVQNPTELAAAVLEPAWQTHSKDRHGSLHALTEWSYRLMKPAEQSLFRCLGLFSGWFDAEDAGAVALEAHTTTPVVLASLVEQSMLVQEQTAVDIRYRLLYTLRAFALQQLDVAGQLDSVQLKHCEHMVSLAERVDLMGPVGDARLRPKVTSMVDDVRAALRTLLRVHPRRAAWLNACMMRTWLNDGRVQECLAWSEQTLAANPEPSPERCWELFGRAFALADLGRSKESREWLREAEVFADSPGNEELRRQTLIVRANCYSLTGDFLSGLRLGQEAIDDFEHRGDEDSLAVALNHTAMSLLWLGHPLEAANLAQRSIKSQDRDSRRLATLDTLAQAHVLLGDLGQARQCWLEAAEQSIETGWNYGLPPCLFGLALVVGLKGHKEAALRFHFVAERLNADLNIRYADPIAERESELMTRFTSELPWEVVERLRSESGALEPNVLLEAVHSDS
jgi:predicted ATPase/DNA-binding CsgD family transcriptional regulator